jgi:hypothetical protein
MAGRVQAWQQGRHYGGEAGWMGPCSFAVAVTFGPACCAVELVQS